MSELTAVEKVIEYYIKERNNGCYQVCIHDLISKLYIAKEIEEEQHREKWRKGFDDAHDMIEYFIEQCLNIRTKKNE